MKGSRVRMLSLYAVLPLILALPCSGYAQDKNDQSQPAQLPAPDRTGKMPLESALRERRSVRRYKPGPLTIPEVSQVLWAAQGVTRPGGYRTAPSAGALYPVEVYLVVGEVEELPVGVYRYLPGEHALLKVGPRDLRRELCAAALEQKCVSEGAALIALTAVYGRTTLKYAQRGIRYAHIEVGAVAQNIYLQAASLGLGTVFIGAFDDREAWSALGLADGEGVLGLMPLGRTGR